MTDTTYLKELSEAAARGPWKAEPSSDHWTIYSANGLEVAVLVEGMVGRPQEEPDDNAVYIVALVNAHRSGQLFTAADVEAARAEEREACAMIADEMRDHCGLDQDGNAYVGEVAHIFGGEVANAVSDAIRARGENT